MPDNLVGLISLGAEVDSLADPRMLASLFLIIIITRACAGLHGAKLAIMGRRQQVIKEAAQNLQSEHLDAIGVQVVSVVHCHDCHFDANEQQPHIASDGHQQIPAC